MVGRSDNFGSGLKRAALSGGPWAQAEQRTNLQGARNGVDRARCMRPLHALSRPHLTLLYFQYLNKYISTMLSLWLMMQPPSAGKTVSAVAKPRSLSTGGCASSPSRGALLS